jgi:Asp-tRNA(Asn)/Glu-tRNA(Gln) amidotransferase A subunit family amidase
MAFLQPRGQDLSRLRVAWTEDFGLCDVDPVIRRAMRAKIDAMRHHFAACDEVRFDLGDAHRCFDILRAEAFVAGMRETYERDPSSLGTNPRLNYEMGTRMSLADVAWAQAEQTRLLGRFQRVFADYDLVLSPVTPVSPFRWTQPHCEQIDGRRQDNYYRWLALTYVVTLTTHPALSLPCGRDELGMPFGMQVTGAFRGDVALLGASRAMEQAFARDPALCRPRPDIARLAVADPGLTSIVTAAPDDRNARVPNDGQTASAV